MAKLVQLVGFRQCSMMNRACCKGFKLGLRKNSINQRELQVSGEHLQFCPQSLGVMLEFWHIELELLTLLKLWHGFSRNGLEQSLYTNRCKNSRRAIKRRLGCSGSGFFNRKTKATKSWQGLQSFASFDTLGSRVWPLSIGCAYHHFLVKETVKKTSVLPRRKKGRVYIITFW